VRKLIPFVILALLSVLAGGAALLSWHQTRDSQSLSIYDCSNTAVVAPSNFVLSCADANSALKDLQWTKWGQGTAQATGTLTWNDCTPNCAAGTWHSTPATVRAERVRNGHYTRLISKHRGPPKIGTFDASPYPPST
jgi:hypothetical protein